MWKVKDPLEGDCNILRDDHFDKVFIHVGGENCLKTIYILKVE